MSVEDSVEIGIHDGSVALVVKRFIQPEGEGDLALYFKGAKAIEVGRLLIEKGTTLVKAEREADKLIQEQAPGDSVQIGEYVQVKLTGGDNG